MLCVGERRRLSEDVRKRAQEPWLLASQLGPAGDEEGRFRSVDEAYWAIRSGFVCDGYAWVL